MSMAGGIEFHLLKKHIKKCDPKDLSGMVSVLIHYFNDIKWSLLKDEWTKMTIGQKKELAVKLLKELQEGKL